MIVTNQLENNHKFLPHECEVNLSYLDGTDIGNIINGQDSATHYIDCKIL
jgi:hypothetical protein